MALLSHEKGPNLRQKNGKTPKGNYITRQQPWTCTEKVAGPSGRHYGPSGPRFRRKPTTRKTDCCCCRILFTQPDFVVQKSHLEELITSRGYICDFYPKY